MRYMVFIDLLDLLSVKLFINRVTTTKCYVKSSQKIVRVIKIVNLIQSDVTISKVGNNVMSRYSVAMIFLIYSSH